MILKDKQSFLPWPILKHSLADLMVSSEKLDSERIQSVLKDIIPTYTPRVFGPNVKNNDSVSISAIKAEA